MSPFLKWPLIIIGVFLVLTVIIGSSNDRKKEEAQTRSVPLVQESATAAPSPSPAPTAISTAAPTNTPSPTPAPTAYPVLKKGSKGEAVIAMQESLITLGYLDGKADGEYGNNTYNAVKAFQKANDLKEDGEAGPATLAKLFSGEAVPAVRATLYINPEYERTVYVSNSGVYHKYNDCSGMKNYTTMTRREAEFKGYKRCEHCW